MMARFNLAWCLRFWAKENTLKQLMQKLMPCLPCPMSKKAVVCRYGSGFACITSLEMKMSWKIGMPTPNSLRSSAEMLVTPPVSEFSISRLRGWVCQTPTCHEISTRSTWLFLRFVFSKHFWGQWSFLFLFSSTYTNLMQTRKKQATPRNSQTRWCFEPCFRQQHGKRGCFLQRSHQKL